MWQILEAVKQVIIQAAMKPARVTVVMAMAEVSGGSRRTFIELEHFEMEVNTFVTEHNETTENGTALYGIQDIELLNILNVKCNAIDLSQGCREINVWGGRELLQTKIKIHIY